MNFQTQAVAAGIVLLLHEGNIILVFLGDAPFQLTLIPVQRVRVGDDP